MPPQMQQVPILEDDSDDTATTGSAGISGAPSRDLNTIIKVLDPASAPLPATEATPALPDTDAAAPPDASAGAAPTAGGPAPASGGPPGTKKLPVLPGNPAFVGGFGSEHPNVAVFAMGDGSIRYHNRGMSGKVLQAMAHRRDGKLDANNW